MHCCVNSITVVLESPEQVTISIPVDFVAFGLLFNRLNVQQLSPASGENLSREEYCDPNWLIRLLVLRAYKILLDSEQGARWVSDDRVLETAIVRHKKEAHVVNGTEYVVPRCSSDRPAFFVKQEWALLDVEPGLPQDAASSTHIANSTQFAASPQGSMARWSAC